MLRLQTLWTERGFRKNFSEKKKRNLKQKRKSYNSVTIASTHADVAVHRIYRRVQIDGKKVRILDTGADVKLSEHCRLHRHRSTKAAIIPSDTEVCQQRTYQRSGMLRMQLHHLWLSGIWYLSCS
ncbi:hypothetical protein RB195_002972 [Necator americanus]|uniref:Peptidase A2 domain-containing protein n=1 Tax=Necator americanus TaxID=51031 RepID=A0ABR1DMZ1_NECAM